MRSELFLNGADNRLSPFHNLMRNRVQEILLVSGLYDSFLLSQDGQLHEQIISESMELNLRHTPGLTHKFDAEEALELAHSDPSYNLIITTVRVGDMHVLEFARRVIDEGLEIPIVLLTFDEKEILEVQKHSDSNLIYRIFMWQGDFRILLAIVKSIEDQWNVEGDTSVMGVPVILLIEDNIRFYSSYLPMIYSELMKHTHHLLSDSVNLYHKLLRMRARPKILHCDNFDEAWEYYIKYENHVLGVITDVEFPVGGVPSPDAGSEFTRRVKERKPSLPVALQSFNPNVKEIAKGLNASYFLKDSPTLLGDLSEFMKEYFGFGDFVFRTPNGTEVARASDLSSLEETLETLPDESLLHHAEMDNFSRWLQARTEFGLAEKLYPRKVSEYRTVDDLRNYLIDSIKIFRRERSRGLVADYSRDTADSLSGFARIGGGSLGGKARGLAFINHLLTNYGKEEQFKNVHISVPSTVVLGTDIFDRFLEKDDLNSFVLQATDDDEMMRSVLKAPFPEEYIDDLVYFMDNHRTPLAVRSSSLLEDSPYQPFAGIYRTYMIPNNHPDDKVRLKQLLDAVKWVYASTFTQQAKAYISMTPYRLEEEKMGIIIQELVGSRHGDRFYPEFSGVARSYNFYPTHPMKSTDGIVSVALGLGKTVVEGGISLRFCPRYPQHLMQFGSIEDYLQYSQKEFFALDMTELDGRSFLSTEPELVSYDLESAEADKTLNPVASVYSVENNAVYDGLSRHGTRIVTFAPVLKLKVFPLPEIIEWLLELGTWGMGTPIEIEFAVNLSTMMAKPKEFSVLQMRPLVLSPELEELDIDSVPPERIICRSPKVLGVGKIDTIRDIIMVNKQRFRRSESRLAADEIGRFNSILDKSGRPYLLIALGRIGSADPWLGIPVRWDQISGARVMVETGFADFKVAPSQGTHFFQNLTSLRIGYFTINKQAGEGMIDWDWLDHQSIADNGNYIRHIRLDKPLVVMMNGHRNQGAILKPE